jgi:hypothetical protein
MRNMTAIKSRHTKPEIIVRSIVHRLGFRFRLHDQKLQGKPDIQAIKGDRLDNLLDELRAIATAAVAIDNDEVEGITVKFRMPDNRSDQNLLARSSAFYTDTEPLEEKFVEAGLDADFRAQLNAARTAYMQALDAADSAVEEHAEAVGAISEIFREMMALSRKRAAIVNLKYRDDAGKRASFVVASHLERAPKKPKSTQPPT